MLFAFVENHGVQYNFKKIDVDKENVLNGKTTLEGACSLAYQGAYYLPNQIGAKEEDHSDLRTMLNSAIKKASAASANQHSEKCSIKFKAIYGAERDAVPESVEICVESDLLIGIFTEYKEPVRVNLGMTINCGHTGIVESINVIGMVPSMSDSEAEKCYFKGALDSDQVTKFKCVEGVVYNGNISVLMCALTDEYYSSVHPTQLMCKAFLDDKIACDFELISKNGSRIPCHKAFIAWNSPVLSVMLQTDCKESKENAYELGLSEDGVKAFLEFIYYGNMDRPNERPTIALELFEAAHKYNVQAMEKAIKNMLLRKQTTWFPIDVALQLFVLTNQTNSYPDLKWRVLQVIKGKPVEMKESSVFDDLLHGDPNTAKELIFRCLQC
ncbi:unnamed protein product [Orchesella dallaii]|uniref:BTB domain-containing protein n=1 Tax=Orchesella dallaii TaxID=48710 RepID=A0ABP1QDP1_9HEXA